MKANAKTYIISKLNELIKDFPQLLIFYKYDPLSKEHLVKVSSFNDYDVEERQKRENDIIFGLIANYPYDSIVFLPDDDWINLSKPDEVLIGDDFINETMFTKPLHDHDDFIENNLFYLPYLDETIANLSEIIYDYHSNISKLESSFNEYLLNSNEARTKSKIEELSDFTENQEEFQHKNKLTNRDNDLICHFGYFGEKNYALAA